MSTRKFEKGDRVKIISECQSHGKCGVVVQYIGYFSDVVQIHLDNGVTRNYNEISLKLINQTEEKSMKITGNYKVALVQFLQGTNTVKGYAFALFDDDIGVDDTVLCDTSHGYGVAKVTDIIPNKEYSGVAPTKEIICKVDFSAFEQHRINREKAQELQKEMDKKIKEMQEFALYEMMAAKDPELKEMFENYKQLMM